MDRILSDKVDLKSTRTLLLTLIDRSDYNCLRKLYEYKYDVPAMDRILSDKVHLEYPNPIFNTTLFEVIMIVYEKRGK